MLLAKTVSAGRTWSERYAARHRLERVTDLPLGVALPARVRIYRRQGHFVVQWWDPRERATLNQRVDGDLIAAIARARDIDEQITLRRSSGQVARRVSLLGLIDAFCNDLRHRADAGEVSPATGRRYASALKHVQSFVRTPYVERNYRFAHQVDRKFRLALSAHLQANQAPASEPRSSSASPAPQFVLDTCRAMFAWAADPQRGKLLGESFANPFHIRAGRGLTAKKSHVGEPDITVEMAAQFLNACDSFQLPLFSTILLCGLRPSEATFAFRELLDDNWLRINCLPELGYLTKGKRDKQFPVVEPLKSLLPMGIQSQGLLFVRRGWQPSPRSSRTEVTRDFARRCAQAGDRTALGRQRLRDQTLLDHGCLNYDRIEGEFHAVAETLDWPPAATIKDFRHLFSTCLENAGMPEFYRRYMMGQSPGRTAIVTYTHLNKLREHYVDALNTEFGPVLAAVRARLESSAAPHTVAR